MNNPVLYPGIMSGLRKYIILHYMCNCYDRESVVSFGTLQVAKSTWLRVMGHFGALCSCCW